MIKETHIRSLVKAFSWRIFATLTTMAISYIITKEISFAIYIGLFEFFSKIIFFYAHERLWAIIPFGLSRTKISKNSQKFIFAKTKKLA